MTYRKATYEEYQKASKFAKIRYKYGVYIQAIAVILFLFIIIYAVRNVEEMKANPKDYTEEKLGVICYPPIYDTIDYNGSTRNIRHTGER